MNFLALPSPINVWAVEESITDNSMTVQWSTVEGAQYYTIEVRPSTGKMYQNLKPNL